MFTGSNVSGNHPFMIGESYGDMNSNHVFGPLNSSNNGSKITVVIPNNFNGSLWFFCTNHSGMKRYLYFGCPDCLRANDLNVRVIYPF